MSYVTGKSTVWWIACDVERCDIRSNPGLSLAATVCDAINNCGWVSIGPDSFACNQGDAAHRATIKEVRANGWRSSSAPTLGHSFDSEGTPV